MSVLEGSLEIFALPDVFRLLAHNRVTGALRIVRESGDGIIYFRDGEVYFAFSSLTREFLGQRLVNAKLITQGQLLRILDEQKKSGGSKRLGDLIVEKGVISKELLDTFIKEQIQDAIFNLLQWDMGQFSFEPDEVSPQEVGLSVSAENLIMESSRRLEEWEVIQRRIPSLDVVVRMAPTPPENAMEINIKPEEWTLLVLADGERTVRDIAAATERSEFEACKILYGLVTAGLLDVASAPQRVAAATEPSRLSPRAFEEDAEPEIPVEATIEAPSEPEAVPEIHQEAPEPQPVAEAPPVAEPVREEPVYEAPAPVPAETQPRVVRKVTLAEEAPAPEVPSAPEPVPVAAHAAPAPAVTAPNGHSGNGNGNGDGPSHEEQPARHKAADATISKEVLLRLIAGVRNL
jgi:hypothetical protein